MIALLSALFQIVLLILQRMSSEELKKDATRNLLAEFYLRLSQLVADDKSIRDRVSKLDDNQFGELLDRLPPP